MDDLRLIGLAENFAELMGLLDQRRRDLGLTALALDAAAGLADGHSTKLACGTKSLGRITIPLLLEALGCKIVLAARDSWVPASTMREAACVSPGRWHKPPPLLPDADHVFDNPLDAATMARRLESSPVTGKRRSLSVIAEELAERGFVSESGEPYSQEDIRKMLGRPGPCLFARSA